MFLPRFKRSRPVKEESDYKVRDMTPTRLQILSTNVGYQQDIPHPSGEGTEGDNGHPEQEEAQSAYYEDLDKKTVSDNHKYQQIGNAGSKIGQQQLGYQNVSVSTSGRGQIKVRGVEGEYDLPEFDVNDNQRGNYEELDQKSMYKIIPIRV